MKLRHSSPALLLALALQGCPTGALPQQVGTPSTSPSTGPATTTAAATTSPSPSGVAPPTGFSQVSLDAGGNHVNGEALSMLLDPNGDPMFAYADNTENSGFPVYFRAWDRARGAWKAPVKVGAMGTEKLGVGDGANELALARDAATGALAMVYPSGTGGPTSVHLATSPDGVTWTDHVLKSTSEYVSEAGHVALAMAAGKAYVGYYFYDNHPEVVEEWHFDTFDTQGNKLADGRVPWPKGVPHANDGYFEPAIALDAGGQPAVAFGLRGYPEPGTTNPTRAVMGFWRPGWTDSVVVDDQQDLGLAQAWGHQFPTLAFHGTKPRVAYYGAPKGSAGHELLVAASDDGRSWDRPVAVPRDYSEWWDGMALTIDAQGRGAIAVGANGMRDDKCGWPKLARTTDFKSWSTCSPDTVNSVHLDGKWPVMALDGRGKLTMLFWNDAPSDSQLQSGYVLWREP
jgi:hypothetical protein